MADCGDGLKRLAEHAAELFGRRASRRVGHADSYQARRRRTFARTVRRASGGRISTSGAITEFSIPTVGAGLRHITAGLDGALWFTEPISNKIGRITTTGLVTEYPYPHANTHPQGITAGPDGRGLQP